MYTHFFRYVAGAICALWLAVISSATASEHTPKFFDIEPQPLSEALIKIGAQGGVTIVFVADELQQHTTRIVHGYMTAEAALIEALSDTPFAFEKHTANVYVIIFEKEPHPASLGVDKNRPFRQLKADKDEIIITATRTKTSLDDLSPIAVISKGDLRIDGAVNIGHKLSELPAVNTAFSSLNTNSISNAAGLNIVDLRSAGPSRTLVLFDGRRIAPTNAGASVIGVDLSSVPISAVRQVEILTGGASALYGPGAIAGVINIDFHDKYDGFTTTVQGGVATRGDAKNILAEIAYGRDIWRGNAHLNVFASYAEAGKLFQVDRKATADPAGFNAGGAFVAGLGRSDVTNAGRVIGFGATSNDFNAFANGASFSISPDGANIAAFTRNIDQLENFSGETLLITPEQRFSGLANLTANIGDNAHIKLELFGAHFVSTSVLPSSPFDAGGTQNRSLFVPTSHPSFPVSVSNLLAQQAPVNQRSGAYIARRFSAFGSRENQIERNSYRAAVILDGDIGAHWSYDAHYQFAASIADSTFNNLIDPERLARAVDPALCAQATNCSLINPFGETALTAGQLGFIQLRPLKNRFFTGQHNASINLRGDIAQIPSGPISFAIGGEYRGESARVTVDPILLNRTIPGVDPIAGIDGSFNSVEGYAEFVVPLLADYDGATKLSVEAAARIMRVARSGLTYSVKGGVRYQPANWLTFRFTQQRALRAPNVNELFSQFSTASSPFKDPCSGLSAATNDVVVTNCSSSGAFGVAPGFQQNKLTAATTIVNNIDLQEERADTLSIGANLYFSSTTSSARDIKFSVDFFRISINDAISTPNLSSILASCYESLNFSSPACGDNPVIGGPIFSRDASTDQINRANLFPLNGGRFLVSGLDFSLAARYAPGLISGNDLPGYIKLRGDYTLLLDARQQAFDGDIFAPLKGQLQFAQHRANIRLSYNLRNFEIGWKLRYRSRATVDPSLGDLDGNHAPAIAYHDLYAVVSVKRDWVMRAGVSNITDASPPLLAFSASGNTYPEYYDVIGRRLYFGVERNF